MSKIVHQYLVPITIVIAALLLIYRFNGNGLIRKSNEKIYVNIVPEQHIDKGAHVDFGGAVSGTLGDGGALKFENAASSFPDTSHTSHRLLETAPAAAVYFLFSLDTSFMNEEIWKEFFRTIPSNYAGKYRAFIHYSDKQQKEAPSFLKSDPKVVVIEYLTNSHDTYGRKLYELEVMIHLLGSSLKESKNSDDMFIFVGDKTIPTKGFHAVADYYLPSETTLGGGISLSGKKKASSFCFLDSSKWEFSNINGQNITAPALQEWVVLTQAHAKKVITEYEKHKEINKLSPLTQAFSDKNTSLFRRILDPVPSHPIDLINFWFFQALFGPLEIINGNTSRVEALELNLDTLSDVEQGTCNTYTFSNSFHPASPFYKVRSHFIKVVPEKSLNIINPSLQFLDDLHDSPEFFFACCFDSQANSGHKIFVRHSGGERLVLSEAFMRLGIFTTPPGQHHNHQSVLESKYSFNKTSIFDMINPKEFKIDNTKRGKGDNGGLKVLVVTIDNRDLKDVLNSNDYVSYASVLLFNYCKLHGYDFLKFTPNAKNLQARSDMKYKLGSDIRGTDAKYGMAVFHSGLKVGRASSWTKLPALWYLITLLGEHYDYFWFLDSDATISPINSKRSLFDSLQIWKNESNGRIMRGNKDVEKSNFIFMSNFPWRDDLPCAGIMILKPNAATEAIIREWWDYDIPPKNYWDFMEQDALWYQLEAPPSYGFNLNFSVATLVDEKAFPSAWYGIHTLWTVHIANYDSNRATLFKNMLKMAGLYDWDLFKNEVAAIYRHHYLMVDIFEVTEAMEDYNEYLRRTGVQSPRRTVDKLPPCRSGKGDDQW
jgi:hypothetical protein